MEQLYKIPIRNLFYLLSYAEEMPELAESLNEAEDELITYDFLAKRFNQEAKMLLRRGLVKSYVTFAESTNRLGGRILMNESMPYMMTRKPIVVCEKDEYSADILFNQVMKTTLGDIYGSQLVKNETRKESYLLAEEMADVRSIPLTKGLLKRIWFSRHNAHYKRMIHIARLLHELKLLSHKKGNWSLFSAELDDRAMHALFEKFLLNFYKSEQKDYAVGAEQMSWSLEGGDRSLLPGMRTDVSLTHRETGDKIIIDAKFYKHMFQEYFGKKTFHSGNLYQMFTYLMHQPKDVHVRGILIYPENEHTVDEVYRWDERATVGVRTLNLNAEWSEIYNRMMDIIK